MKQIILPSTVFEFTWLVIDGIMEENGIASFSKKEIRTPPIQKATKKFEIFPGPGYNRQKVLAPHKKIVCG